MADKPPAPVRVLIVEDSIDLAEVLRGHLETLGCAVTVVSSLTDANYQLALKKTGPQLVLADLTAPAGTGAKILKTAGKGSAVVAVTGGSATDLKQPIDRSQLAALVDQARASG